eukprot:gb/GECH01000389.1/.p1 GENE.gb/GECH01000389.1/~~gb/GECH01000389.1/.p1  ORF type:complete len:832 (+),score=175.58 gb/GECH01000389.1/:1-2496(+)
MRVSNHCFNRTNKKNFSPSNLSHTTLNRSNRQIFSSDFSVLKNDAQLGRSTINTTDLNGLQPDSQQRFFRYHHTRRKRRKRKVRGKSTRVLNTIRNFIMTPPKAFFKIAGNITTPPRPPILDRLERPWYSLPRLGIFHRLFSPAIKFLRRHFFVHVPLNHARWPNRYQIGFRGYEELETPGAVYSPYLSTWISRENLAKTSNVLIPIEEVRHDYTVFTFFPRLKHNLKNTMFNLLKSENHKFNARDWKYSLNLEFVPMLLYGIWNQDYELLRQFMVHDYNIHFSFLRHDRDGKELGLKNVLDDPDIHGIQREWDKWKNKLMPRLEKKLKEIDERIEKEKKEKNFVDGEFNLDYSSAEEDLYRKGMTQEFQKIIDRHLEPNHPLRQSSLSEEKKVKFDKLLLEDMLERCQMSKQMYQILQKETHRVDRRIRPYVANEIEPENHDIDRVPDLSQDVTNTIDRVTSGLGSAHLNELGEPQKYAQMHYGVKKAALADIKGMIEEENEELDDYYDLEENEREQVPSVVLWSDIQQFKREKNYLDRAFLKGVETPRRRLYAYEMKRLAHLIFPMFRGHHGDGVPNMKMKVHRVRPASVSKTDIYTQVEDNEDLQWQQDQIKPYMDSLNKLYLKQLKGEQLSLSNEEMQSLINNADESQYDWDSIPANEDDGIEADRLPSYYDFEDRILYYNENWDRQYKRLVDRSNLLFEKEKKHFRWLRSTPPLDAEDRFHEWRKKRARSRFGDTDLYSYLRHPRMEEPDERLDLEGIEKFREKLGKRIKVKFIYHFSVSGIFGDIVTSDMHFKSTLKMKLQTDPTGRTNDWQVASLVFGKPRRKR